MSTRLLSADKLCPDIDIHDQFCHGARVEVTLSTIEAYARMGRRMIVENESPLDPLHSALYPLRSRRFPQSEVQLPFISDVQRLAPLPVGTRYYWDPIVAKKVVASTSTWPHSRSQSVYKRTAKRDSGYNGGASTSANAEPYIPGPLPYDANHYRGDMVWANFGYLSYHGRWVDPDSQRELKAAYEGKTAAYHYRATNRVIDAPRQPGPKLMLPGEEISFYEWFNEEVFDVGEGGDTEGDPRNLRITPETFAFWAQGAIKGNYYDQMVMEPEQTPIPPHLYDMEGIIPQKRKIKPPFKHNSHSILTGVSGIYEVDGNPGLLYGALGVDVTREPHNFKIMSPQTAGDLNRARFLGLDTGPASSTTASSPEPYTNIGAVEYLSPADPIGGAREFAERVERVNEKRRFKDELLRTNTTIMNSATNMKWELDQQVDRMQEVLQEKTLAKAAEKARRRAQPKTSTSSTPVGAGKTLRRESRSVSLSSSHTSKCDTERIQNRPGSKTSTRVEKHMSESSRSASPMPTKSNNLPSFDSLPPPSPTLLRAFMPPSAPASAPTSRPASPSSAAASHAYSPSPEAATRPKKPKKQYSRFFKELAEDEEMIDRETEVAETLTVGYQDIMDEIEMLKHLTDDLSRALENASADSSQLGGSSQVSVHENDFLVYDPHYEGEEVGGDVI